MRQIPIELFQKLQFSPSQIRNLCILAHVDHGKTSLADSLVATNGIISPRMVGRLRYMDSRLDEQERGITMKSSAISLYYKCDGNDFLINLVDSPGHIDFCGEVSTAIRSCDGALIVVDSVEGVCPQTNAVLRQSCKEGLRPILVLNKIDRLITELKMTPTEAYKQLNLVLGQINSIAGEILLSGVLEKDITLVESDMQEMDIEEEKMYFSPDRGNVIFCSALDGWGFQITDFVSILSKKYGFKEKALQRSLWGDFYVDNKSKKIRKGCLEKGKKPIFVQLVLENIWSVYQNVLIEIDEEKTRKIIDSLAIKLSAREQKHRDPKIHLQAIMTQWLPVAAAVLNAVCRHLPPANQLQNDRLDKLINIKNGPELSNELKSVRNSLQECKCESDAQVIVFVSKMCAVERKNLPQNKKGPLSLEDIQKRRKEAVENQKVRFDESNAGTEVINYCQNDPIIPAVTENDYVFLGFARVFSGTVYKGQKLFVIPPNHDITNPGEHVQIEIQSLYLFMGRELEEVSQVPAGNLVGIGGVEDHMLNSGTLSSSLICPPLSLVQPYAEPIIRVSIEPRHPGQMPALVKGLKLLNQADPCVKLFVQDTGEHVLVTSGEVHLERCIADLKERFSTEVDDLVVSEPIIPFMETIVPKPKLDNVNELIQSQNMVNQLNINENEAIEISTPNKRSVFRIRAVPLPSEVVELLEKNENLLSFLEIQTKNISKDYKQHVTSEMRENLRKFRQKLLDCFENIWRKDRGDSSLFWGTNNLGDTLKLVDQIWSFGPRKAKANILFSRIPEYQEKLSIWQCLEDNETHECDTKQIGSETLLDWDRSVVTGFNLRCSAGPLCEEPLRAVGFIIEDWTYDCDHCDISSGPMAGQIISSVKEGCKLAFQAQPQRLLAAMYSCLIQATTDVLGKVYAVLSKRGGMVLFDEMKEGTNLFQISATLPVVESFGFANEMRKRTSGLASPQLVFSHWELIDMDPFWVPTTEEELLHFGDTADSDNQARKYMNAVRKRKGLSVDEKIVQFAEKQRTLKKNK